MKPPHLEPGFVPPTWPLDATHRLRPLRPGDEVAWHGYLQLAGVVEHTSIPDLDLPAVRGMVERTVEACATATGCRWAIADARDELVGTCGFTNWSFVHAHAELAYDLHPELWGRGLMRRAARHVVDWAFDNDFHRVHALVMTSNAPSIRVLDHLGFAREGLLRDYRMARGEPRDFYMYALLRQPPGRG
jgi:ribosomal-protein-alanine N-acetyltransferase